MDSTDESYGDLRRVLHRVPDQPTVEYDDTALEDMLHNAHRVHVYHSQREGLSVGQSSSSVSERTGRPVEERSGRPDMVSCQELNVENAQIIDVGNLSKWRSEICRTLFWNYQAEYKNCKRK